MSYSYSRTKLIEKIKFGLLSPDEIRKMSAARIITADTYDEDGLPIPSGLMDQRLGTIEPGQRCQTCGNLVSNCMGHFGHIELARPVIHVGYAKKVLKCLRSICPECSRLMLSDEEREKHREEQIKHRKIYHEGDEDITKIVFKSARKNKVCPFCGAKKKKIILEKPTTFYEEEEAKGSRRLTPIEIRERLKKMTDADLRILGISPKNARLEWVIFTVLPIPPVCARPSITLDSGIRSEDDLTHKLVDVIRINQRLRENIDAGAPHLIVEDLWELLQYHITTYFDNQVSGIPPARHRSGRALRTLTQRLKGKEGRFRSNLSGKRVDFSARSVISPNPHISINEVGVPKDIAKILTIPTNVNDWNIEQMKQLVLNGPNRHPGANYIIRNDRRRIDLRYVKNRKIIADMLAPGFTVERHLNDGDLVLFNRQPSLHRMSIMAHEVKIMDGRTFRLNLTVCLEGNTPIITDAGKIKIKHLVNNFEQFKLLSSTWKKELPKDPTNIKVIQQGIKEAQIINAELHEEPIKGKRIITEMGRVLETTLDHPFYTEKGKIAAGLLSKGDRVAVYPIEVPEIEANKGEIILTPDDILNHAPPNSYTSYLLKELKNIKLLNIPQTSKKQIILASLVGHLMSDGTLCWDDEGVHLTFRTGEIEDIEQIKAALESIGIKTPKPKLKKSRGDEITTVSGDKLYPKGKGYIIDIRKKPIAIAFHALGVPVGDKVTQEFPVPKWILKGSKMVKRAFLRGYFGGELSSPRLHTKSSKVINQPVFKMSKIDGLSAHGFFEDINTLLKEFGTEVSSYTTQEGKIRKKDGKRSTTYVANIISNEKQLISFYKKIGCEFSNNKEVYCRLMAEYLTLKYYTRMNQQEVKMEAIDLRKRGLALEQIANKYNVSPITISRWERGVYDKAGLPIDFPSFNEWLDENTKGLNDGLVWDKIKSIENITLNIAYDVSMDGNYDNFIANQFLTGNCPPYNADFDGDEMNLHVPQSEEARTEAELLLKVQEHILSPRFGGPILGGIQDFISSVFQFTSKESIYNPKDTLKLLYMGNVFDQKPNFDMNEVEPIQIDPEPMYSGKQIFSTLLPEDLNIRVRSKFYKKCFTKPGQECKEEDCEYDAYVRIVNGELQTGTIDENSFGAMQSNSILQRIIKDHGNARGREFLDSATQMLLYVIRQNGMTMGLDEVYVKGEAFEEIQKVLNESTEESKRLIKAFRENDTDVLQRAPGRSLKETLELRIRQVLAEARKKAEEIAANYIGDEAHSVIMTKSGARGNILNLGQMSAVVGQQAIRGERINRGYSSRTLPHFKVDDLTPRARGFVEQSYRNGLDPSGFFFHAMGGREGLVDTAVRTSTSGYMQRRLVNALQDMVIENDGTVRNADKNIIQFDFGDDNINPQHTDHGDAVNLDVLLLKAQTLDTEEIQESLKQEKQRKKEKPKSVPSKETPKIESTKEKQKEVKEAPTEEEMRAEFEKETDKNAVWQGKITKQYKEWREEKYGI
jgi:DNA-directed RNA polymerase subunit A'